MWHKNQPHYVGRRYALIVKIALLIGLGVFAAVSGKSWEASTYVYIGILALLIVVSFFVPAKVR